MSIRAFRNDKWQLICIGKLFPILFKQSYATTPAITLQEGNTISFRWEVNKFNLYANSTIASPCFVSPERHRWRGIWENSAL